MKSLRVCLLIILFIFIFLLFRIIRILIEKKEYKKLNEYINNWEKNPIVDISTNYSKNGFNDENDYFIINSTKLYIKRTKKKYIYPILINKIFTNIKVCGKIDNIYIYFPKYEKCPINYLNLTNYCISNSTCIQIDSNLFLYYSNSEIDNEIYVDISFDKELKYNSYIAKKIKLEQYYSIKYEKKTNISIILIEIVFINLFFIISFYVWFIKELNDLFMIIFLLLYILFLLLYGFYSVNLSKYRNNVIKILKLCDIKENKFIHIFYTLDKVLYFLGFPFFFFFSILFYIFTPFIVVLNNLNYNLSQNGFYKDLLNTINKSPISNIHIERNKITNLEFYEFAYLKTEDQIIILNVWKDNYFYITRMDNKYNYKSLKKKGKNKKICGLDNNNKNLYFPNNIECPINFIEITSSENCSISKNYNCISQKLNNNFYLHYSNEYINGKILIDFKISTNLLPIGNNQTFNEICYYLNFDNCILDNEYYGYDNNTYGYSLIDSNNFMSIDFLTNKKKLFLYSRSYVNINNNLNNLFLMKKLSTKGFIIYIIISDIITDILIIIYFFHKKFFYLIIIEMISLIAFILTIIESIISQNVKNELKNEEYLFDIKDEITDVYNYFNSLLILWKKNYYIFYLIKLVIFSCIIILVLYCQDNFLNIIRNLMKKIKEFIFKKKEKKKKKQKKQKEIQITE